MAELQKWSLQPCPNRTDKPPKSYSKLGWQLVCFDKCRPRWRPRQQTPFCMTMQLSLTLLYSNAAGIVMVPRLSFALSANHPAIKTLQQVPAPSGRSSYQSRQQQCSAHNTAHTKLLTTIQYDNDAEVIGAFHSRAARGSPKDRAVRNSPHASDEAECTAQDSYLPGAANMLVLFVQQQQIGCQPCRSLTAGV